MSDEARPTMQKPVRRSNGPHRRPGPRSVTELKVLLAACSVSATIAGWALISNRDALSDMVVAAEDPEQTMTTLLDAATDVAPSETVTPTVTSQDIPVVDLSHLPRAPVIVLPASPSANQLPGSSAGASLGGSPAVPASAPPSSAPSTAVQQPQGAPTIRTVTAPPTRPVPAARPAARTRSSQ